MFRHLLVLLGLLLCAIAGEAQEILLPTPQPPPEHSSARFSDLIETNVADIPTVVEEHGERRPSNAQRGSTPVFGVRGSARLGASRPSRGSVSATTPSFSFPINLANFQGLGDNGLSIPPDTTGAVGPQHVMVTLNTQVQIEDRSGAVISTKSLSTFWNHFGSFSNVFDPRVLYDPYGQRWVAAALANSNSTSSAILVAVSNSSDPTGTWTYYKFSGDPNPSGTKTYWADYTNLGFNKNWIVVSVNLIPFGSGNTNDARILAISKADAYAGALNPSVAAFVVNNGNTFVPAYTYDPTLDTMYLADEFDNTTGQLRISTITGPVGAEVITTGTAFVNSNNSWAAFPANGDFAPQKGDSRLISTGDSRLQNLIYRNGDLWASQTVFLPVSNPTHSLIQWWQMSPSATLKQFVRIEDTSAQNFYAYPGLAVNKDNFVMVGFTQFASTIYASAAYALQAPGTVNDMTVSPTIFKAGTGPYFKDFNAGENRWGDYSVSDVDPVDDNDFWTLQEYSATIATVSSSQFGVWWLHLLPGDGNVVARPETYAFGTQALQSTTTQLLTIVNTNASSVTINGFSFAGAGASAYSQTNLCPASLASGASCNVSVSFKPGTAGEFPATLLVDNSGTPSPLQVPLTGVGQDNGPPDSYPGLSVSWGTPAVAVSSNLTADSGDPIPSCQGNLISTGQTANTAWYQYVPDTDGSISYSANSTSDFALSVWTRSRRTGLYQLACARAQLANGIFTVSNANLNVAHSNGYYFMFSVMPGDVAQLTLNLPATGSPIAMTAINSGLQFFPDSFNSTATQVVAIPNGTTTAQPLGVSSTNPAFAVSFVPGTQCSPTVLAGTTCVASITYTPSGSQPALPHATGTLSLTGNVTPTSSNLKAIVPTDLTPYSAPYSRTIDSLPFTDTKQVPVIPASDSAQCFAMKAPLFYTFSPTQSGTINVNLANYVVSAQGSDASTNCYSQFGAGNDTGFSVIAGVTYSLEIGTDSRATIPSSETVTLTGSGSVVSLSPSPVFFGRFTYGGTSAPVAMTLTNGSANPVPVTFSGSPFSVSNSTCDATLAANSSCTFNLAMTAPPAPVSSLPYTTTFSAGSTQAAVTWNSPPMTLLASATSLQFVPLASGYTSAPQKLVLVMQDNIGPVQIQTTGDFSQTNDCALATYIRPYCTVTVSFMPSVSGVSTGILTINYNVNPPAGASSSTLNIALNGTGLPAEGTRPSRISPRPSSNEVIHPAATRSVRPNSRTAQPPVLNKRTKKLKSRELMKEESVN